jgi:hypothetical protein
MNYAPGNMRNDERGFHVKMGTRFCKTKCPHFIAGGIGWVSCTYTAPIII